MVAGSSCATSSAGFRPPDRELGSSRWKVVVCPVADSASGTRAVVTAGRVITVGAAEGGDSMRLATHGAVQSGRSRVRPQPSRSPPVSREEFRAGQLQITQRWAFLLGDPCKTCRSGFDDCNGFDSTGSDSCGSEQASHSVFVGVSDRTAPCP